MTNPVAYLKEWTVNGDPRVRVDLYPDLEPWMVAYHPTVTPLYRPAAEPPAKCTCQPLAQQLGVPFGLTAVAVDPECPVHREPAGKHEVVKYPDPPYELLGDSGKIHCPMCCGEGMVDPPSENREAPRNE